MPPRQEFRLYLLSKDGKIKAADWFTATSDKEAIDMAAVVYEACDDQFGGYEVWRAQRRLVHVKGASPPTSPRLEELIGKHQDQVIALEERLKDSFMMVRESRKLLATTERFLAQRYAPPPSAHRGDADGHVVQPSQIDDGPHGIVHRVDVGRMRVERQEEIVALLEKNGHHQAAVTARAVLTTLKATLTLMRAYLTEVVGRKH